MSRKTSKDIVNSLNNPSKLKALTSAVLTNKIKARLGELKKVIAKKILDEELSKAEAEKKVELLNKNLKHGQWKLIPMSVPGSSKKYFSALNTTTRERIDLDDFDKVLGAE